MMTDGALRILLVDQNMTRASILEEGLREAGYTSVTVVRDMQNLLRRIVDADPDVICIDLENPNRDVLEQMFQMSRVRAAACCNVRGPFGLGHDPGRRGIGCGRLCGRRPEEGARKGRRRHGGEPLQSVQRPARRARAAKQALGERKVVERAKGILMKERGLTEEAAYALLRKAAMSDNKRVVEIAQSGDYRGGTVAMKMIVGFIPLLDCASLVVAAERGFAAQEGLELGLVRETSWANIRDRVIVGHFDAAHMLGADDGCFDARHRSHQGAGS